MVTWPAALKVSRNGFSESPPNNLVKSDMDAGPQKVRRRTTANTRAASLVLFLTTAELATLETFFVTTIYSGALPFDFTHPRTGETVEARITEPPEYSSEETMWQVTIKMEILP